MVTPDEPKPPAPVDPNPDQPDPGEPFSHFLQILRGSVRPIVTAGLTVAFTAAFLRAIWAVDLPKDVWTGVVVGFSNLVSMAAGVYFGQRNK